MRKFKRRVILKNYIFIYLVIIFIEVFYSIDKIGLMISPKMINIIKNNISYYDNILIEEYLDTKELRDSYIEELITIDKNSKEEIVNIDINTSKSYILLKRIVNNLTILTFIFNKILYNLWITISIILRYISI